MGASTFQLLLLVNPGLHGLFILFSKTLLVPANISEKV